MLPLLTDSQFNSVALVAIAFVGIVPTTLAAYWAKGAKNRSEETAAEVRTNGGMTDPNPNVNDHIKYQTELLEGLVGRQDNTEKLLADHISVSRVMNQALAEVYLTVQPSKKLRFILDNEDIPE